MNTNLKQQFRDADTALIAGLNGIGRPRASEAELVELRRAVMQARAACEAAGIEVESVWEYSQRRKREDETEIRSVGQRMLADAPYGSALSRSARKWLSYAGAAAVSVAVMESVPATANLLVTCAVGFVVFFAVGVLAIFHIDEWFPTTPTKIARLAVEAGVDVSDLWRDDQTGLKDYNNACKRHLLRV